MPRAKRGNKRLQTRGGADTNDPQRAKITLLQFTSGVSEV